MTSPKVNRVNLELLTTGVSTTISPEIAQRMTAEEYHEVVWNRLVAQLTTRVLAQQTISDTRTYAVHHPASWWQHLKYALFSKRWFPVWCEYRWPVRWDRTRIKVEFKQYEAYPKASIAVPASTFGYPVMVDLVNDEIDTAFLVQHDGGGKADDREYLNQRELAHRIASALFKRNPHYDAKPPTPEEILFILDTLAQWGVNPNALVRRDNAR